MNTFKRRMSCWYVRMQMRVLQGQLRRARRNFFGRWDRPARQLELPFRG